MRCLLLEFLFLKNINNFNFIPYLISTLNKDLILNSFSLNLHCFCLCFNEFLFDKIRRKFFYY